jgi:hypothetical protein
MTPLPGAGFAQESVPFLVVETAQKQELPDASQPAHYEVVSDKLTEAAPSVAARVEPARPESKPRLQRTKSRKTDAAKARAKSKAKLGTRLEKGKRNKPAGEKKPK